MGYVLKNGDKYLGIDHRGSYTITDKSRAMVWKREESVKNVIDSLPKILLKHNLKIMALSGGIGIENQEITSEKIKYVTNRTIDNKSYKDVESFINLVLNADNRRDELSTELSKYDAEINDILHAAEFYTLNASQGYKIYKQLHTVRNKRRAVKDELKVIEYLSQAVDKTKVKSLQKQIDGIGKKTYSPRVNEELFINGTEHI